MDTIRIRHLIAGGVLATLAALGAPALLAQPPPRQPPDPGNPGLNANDARCLAEPFVIQCQGGKFGQVPGAFDGQPAPVASAPGIPTPGTFGDPSMPGLGGLGGI